MAALLAVNTPAMPGRYRRDKPLKVSLVGSSFIRRLHEDIYYERDGEFKDNFGLENIRVRTVCQGGWKVKDVWESLGRIATQAPDIVILQIGSNDLGNTRHPELVAEDVLRLAEQTQKVTGAKSVLACESMFRQRGRYLRSQDEVDRYNTNARKFNAYLEVVSADEQCCKFWRHKGMRQPNEEMGARYGPILGRDGVHLSRRGMYKYYKSIRGAINYAAKRLI